MAALALGLIGGFLLGIIGSLIAAIFYDRATRPKLTIIADTGRAQGQIPNRPSHEFYHVLIRNEPAPWMFPGRKPAWDCKVNIEVVDPKGNRILTRHPVAARWASQPEPLIPVLHDSQTVNLIDFSRLVMGRKANVHAHEDQPVSIVLKYDGDPNCFLFSNESYFYPGWANPEWKLGLGVHHLRLTVLYERGREVFRLTVRNSGPSRNDVALESITRDSFWYEKASIEDNPTKGESEQVTRSAVNRLLPFWLGRSNWLLVVTVLGGYYLYRRLVPGFHIVNQLGLAMPQSPQMKLPDIEFAIDVLVGFIWFGFLYGYLMQESNPAVPPHPHWLDLILGRLLPKRSVPPVPALDIGAEVPEVSELYRAAVQMVVHSDALSWTRLTSFLTTASILMAAWIALFTHGGQSPIANSVFVVISLLGLVLSVAWAAFGSRNRRLHKRYADVARRLEAGRDWSPDLHKGPLTSDELSYLMLEELFRTQRLVVVLPLLFGSGFLVLFLKSV